MQTVMWHKRRVLTIVVISIAAFILLRSKSYDCSDERVLPDVKAERVWEFLADFSNTKKYLIPHMRNFTISAESGNYDHWKYSVTYEEPLPLWPYLESFGVGHYSIRTEGDKYIISSEHNACFFHGLACSASKAVFIIRQVDKDTHYKEDIVYDCPPLLSHWCSRVADYTRQDFMKNLVNHFRLKRD